MKLLHLERFIEKFNNFSLEEMLIVNKIVDESFTEWIDNYCFDLEYNYLHYLCDFPEKINNDRDTD